MNAVDDEEKRWNPDNWPESFRRFLGENGIAPSIYLYEPKRFV